MGSITDAMNQALQKRPQTSPASSNPQPPQQSFTPVQQQIQTPQAQPQNWFQKFIERGRVKSSGRTDAPQPDTLGSLAPNIFGGMVGNLGLIRNNQEAGQAALGVGKEFLNTIKGLSPLWYLLPQNQKEQLRQSVQTHGRLQQQGGNIGKLAGQALEYETTGAAINPFLKALTGKSLPAVSSVLGQVAVGQANLEPGQNRLKQAENDLLTGAIFAGAGKLLKAGKNVLSKPAGTIAENGSYVADVNTLRQAMRQMTDQISFKSGQSPDKLYNSVSNKVNIKPTDSIDDVATKVSKVFKGKEFNSLNPADVNSSISNWANTYKTALAEMSQGGQTVYRGTGATLPDRTGTNMFGNATYYSRSPETAAMFGNVEKSNLGLKSSEILKINNQSEFDNLVKNALKKNPGMDVQQAIPEYVKSLGYKAVEGSKNFDELAGIAVYDKNLVSSLIEKGSSTGKKLPLSITQQTQEAAGKDVSTFYNLNKLKISNKAKDAIQGEISNAGKQLNETVGKRLSNREVIDFANRTSQILDDTVTRDATKSKIAANLNLRRKIAEVAQSGKIDKNFVDLWIKDKAAGEDIARQLQARNIVADPADAQHIQAMLDSIYKVNKNADEIAKAASGVDFNDAKQVTEFYRKFVKPKAGEWIDLLRYNSMLSSPKTHLVNASSNLQGTSVIAPLEKTVAGGLDYLRSSITGAPRTRYAGEGLAYTKGYLSKESWSDASKRFADVMRGKSFNYNPDVRNIPLAAKGPGKAVEKVLSPVTKLLEASDQFFTSLTEGGSKKALEYRAIKSGVPIADVASRARDEAAYRLFRETGNSSQGTLLKSIDEVTNKLMALRGSDNAFTSTIAKFTLPFVRTPTNILKQGIEYSPLGLTTLIGSTDKTGQLAKAVIGMASAAGAASLLGQGRLTWAEPTGEAQKTKFRSEGKIPYAIKVGDKWISYSKLHPALAFNFALVSAIDDEVKNKKLSETDANDILNSFAKYGNFIADQSYLKSIGDAIAATKGDADRLGSFFSNYPQQLIPFRALMGWVTKLTDPYQRQVDKNGSLLDKQMQYIMTQIPGLSEKVPTRKDLGGAPLKNQSPLLNALTPLTVSKQTDVSKQNILFKTKFNELQASENIANAKNEVERTHVSKVVDGTLVYYSKVDNKVHTKKL